MPTEQEAFSFELSETLFFDKGQEVKEMISISLDPEISIQPFNDYVSIRGVIELNGKYVKEEARNSDVDTLDVDDFHSKRFIEHIDDNDDGFNQFNHRFPVEISVPKYRILDTNNITVGVDAFDYELPSENQMKIKAMIHIHGISSHREQSPPIEQVAEQESVSHPLDQKDDLTEESFSFEMELKDDSEREPASKNNHQSVTPLMEYTSKLDERSRLTEDQNEEQIVDEAQLTVDDVIEERTDANVEELIEDTDRHEIDVHTQEQETDSNHEVEGEGFNFLATLFQDKDEEQETYSQMRICIVQENDTLETIAERYHVPKLHILKVNRLEDDDLQEGQLLSIPKKKTKKS